MIFCVAGMIILWATTVSDEELAVMVHLHVERMLVVPVQSESASLPLYHVDHDGKNVIASMVGSAFVAVGGHSRHMMYFFFLTNSPASGKIKLEFHHASTYFRTCCLSI